MSTVLGSRTVLGASTILCSGTIPWFLVPVPFSFLFPLPFFFLILVPIYQFLVPIPFLGSMFLVPLALVHVEKDIIITVGV